MLNVIYDKMYIILLLKEGYMLEGSILEPLVFLYLYLSVTNFVRVV